MTDSTKEATEARQVLDAATANVVAMLTRKIAFAPTPAAALEPCRAAVRQVLGEYFQHLTPEERGCIFDHIIQRAVATALDILHLDHSFSRERGK